MRTKTICFASSKGGSGKTTLTAALGTFLSQLEKRVLIIDCDEGTHGLTLMYLTEVNTSRKSKKGNPVGLFSTSASISTSEIVASILNISPFLDMLPAKFSFSEQEEILTDEMFSDRLSSIIQTAKKNYDFVLLDAQSGIGSASRVSMSPEISDQVILVSEYDPMSNAGIERMKARLPMELDITRTWILLNKLLPEFVSKFSEFLSVANYLPPIPWTADVVRAYSRRKLALDLDNGNQFTLATLAVLKEILKEDDKHLLNNWVEEQTIRLKEPIKEQLQDAELLVRELEKQVSYDKKMAHPRESMARRLKRSIRLIGPMFLMTGALVGMAGSMFSIVSESSALEDMFKRIFPENTISGVIFLVSIGFSILYLAQQILTMSSDGEMLVFERHEKLDEIVKTRKRITQLKELLSANYEDILLKDKQRED